MDWSLRRSYNIGGLFRITSTKNCSVDGGRSKGSGIIQRGRVFVGSNYAVRPMRRRLCRV